MRETPEAVTNERRDALRQPERAPRAALESHGARGPRGEVLNVPFFSQKASSGKPFGGFVTNSSAESPCGI